jgi:hypothetical protein
MRNCGTRLLGFAKTSKVPDAWQPVLKTVPSMTRGSRIGGLLLCAVRMVETAVTVPAARTAARMRAKIRMGSSLSIRAGRRGRGWGLAGRIMHPN